MIDAVRIVTVIIGGLSFGVAIPVLRLIIAEGVRAEAFAARLFGGIHLAIVVYIAGVLAERGGDPMSWYTPAAVFIFTAKLIGLLVIREIMWSRELRNEPPIRRAEDQVMRNIRRQAGEHPGDY